MSNCGCIHLLPLCNRSEVVREYRALVQVALVQRAAVYSGSTGAHSGSTDPGSGSKRGPRVPALESSCLLCPSHSRLFACLQCQALTCLRWDPVDPVDPWNPSHPLDPWTQSNPRPHTQHQPHQTPHQPHLHLHLRDHFEKTERIARLAAVRNKQPRPQCSVFAVDLSSFALYCWECKDVVWDIELMAILDEERAWVASAVHTAHYDSSQPSFYRPTLHPVPEGQFSIPKCSGLRGLRNLGNTCYMNVILQSFIHNPVMKECFLGDVHRHDLCNKRECTACEVDKLFCNFFAGETTPFSPTTFLYNLWKRQKDMAGAHQHDAHEFFIRCLESIHYDIVGQNDSSSCTCLSHRTFNGTQTSNVICKSCGHTSKTKEGFGDISLSVNTKSSKGYVTLADCLRRYTAPEKCNYTCPSCSKKDDSTKQYSFAHLPPVLSIQFKRFEKFAATTRKIETPVVYPSLLDMSPYISPPTHLSPSRNTSPVHPGYGGDNEDIKPPIYYDLFSVVSHRGSLETGHYTVLSKHRGVWYLFDDDMVIESDETLALNGVPIMELPGSGSAGAATTVDKAGGSKSGSGHPTFSSGKGSSGAYMLFYVRRDAAVQWILNETPNNSTNPHHAVLNSELNTTTIPSTDLSMEMASHIGTGVGFGSGIGVGGLDGIGEINEEAFGADIVLVDDDTGSEYFE